MESTIHPSLLSAREAIAKLGIKRDTLYAYVSRGLLRSVPGDTKRERRYYRSDVERLEKRRDARAGHAAVAATALRWGEPVLDSAITRIDPVHGPIYRGIAATDLVEASGSAAGRGRVPFESAASLLWEGKLPAVAPSFTASVHLERHLERVSFGLPARATAALIGDHAPLPLLAAIVPLLAVRDAERFQSPDASEHARGRILVARMAASLGLVRRREERAMRAESVARTVALALGERSREAAQALDMALVLCADHELNASTFAARVAASAGADLYACVAAAIATLSGPKHGGACDRVEALIAETESPGNAARIVRERTRRGESVPGFGHLLYTAGDPRTPPLLEAAQAIAPGSEVVKTIRALNRAMHDAGREPPTLDLGLVALAGALGLPRGSAVALFAIGRTAGWIAHVLEQRSADFLLRPRARYVGV